MTVIGNCMNVCCCVMSKPSKCVFQRSMSHMKMQRRMCRRGWTPHISVMPYPTYLLSVSFTLNYTKQVWLLCRSRVRGSQTNSENKTTLLASHIHLVAVFLRVAHLPPHQQRPPPFLLHLHPLSTLPLQWPPRFPRLHLPDELLVISNLLEHPLRKTSVSLARRCSLHQVREVECLARWGGRQVRLGVWEIRRRMKMMRMKMRKGQGLGEMRLVWIKWASIVCRWGAVANWHWYRRGESRPRPFSESLGPKMDE